MKQWLKYLISKHLGHF